MHAICCTALGSSIARHPSGRFWRPCKHHVARVQAQADRIRGGHQTQQQAQKASVLHRCAPRAPLGATAPTTAGAPPCPASANATTLPQGKAPLPVYSPTETCHHPITPSFDPSEGVRDHEGRLVFDDHPEFRPNLTPKQVIQAGSFGGCDTLSISLFRRVVWKFSLTFQTFWRLIHCRIHKNSNQQQ